MRRFVVKHLVFLLLTLFCVSFLVFTMNEFSPGAVARKILGAYATQEQVDLLTTQMGLDRPLLVRYVDYVRAVVSGDLGQSARFKVPVRDVVVVETVFAYPGFGRMMLEAALFKDIALVEAGALVAVFLAVLTNILGDLAYMLLDPRIRA